MSESCNITINSIKELVSEVEDRIIAELPITRQWLNAVINDNVKNIGLSTDLFIDTIKQYDEFFLYLENEDDPENNITEDDVRTMYDKAFLSANNIVEQNSFDQEVKNEESDEEIDRLDGRLSYLSNFNASERDEFLQHIKNMFGLYLTYDDDGNVIYTNGEFNDALWNKIYSIALDLYNKTGRNQQVDIPSNNADRNRNSDINFINSLLTYLNNSNYFNTNLSRQKEQFFEYIILSNIDSVLREVFGKKINIANGYFNSFDINKPLYSRASSKKMGTSWISNEEDYDDIQEIGEGPILAIELLSLYTAQGNSFVKNNKFKLDFASVLDSMQDVVRIIYSKDSRIQELLNETFVIEDRSQNSFYYWILNNFGKNVYNSFLKGRTVRDVICNISADRTILTPIIFKRLINSDKFTNYFRENDILSLEIIYSIYEQIYNIDNKESLYSKELNDLKHLGIQSKLFNIINQVFNTVTHLQYVRYYYDSENNVIKRVKLNSKHARYAINEFVRNLSGLHRANDPHLNLTKDKLEELKQLNTTVSTNTPNMVGMLQVDLDDKYFGFLVTISRSNERGLFAIRIKLNDADGKGHTIELRNGKIESVDGNRGKSLVSTINIGWINQYLEKAFPIRLNDTFLEAINNNQTLRSNLITIFFNMLNHIYANEIENNIQNESLRENEKQDFIIYGYAFADDKQAKNAYKKWFSNVKCRKNSPQLELLSANVAYLLRNVVDMNDKANNIVRSSMVEDANRLQLNLSKLWQAGNAMMQLSAEQRANPNNPSSSLVIFDCFNGGTVLRDFTDKTNKTKLFRQLNAKEQFKTLLFTDFLGGFNANINEIGIPGAVVSDKPYIYNIMLLLDKKINYQFTDDNKLLKITNNDKSRAITLKQLMLHKNSTELIKSLVINELGEYYSKQYDFVLAQIDKINAFTNNDFLCNFFGIPVNIDFGDFRLNMLHDFKEFNDIINTSNLKARLQEYYSIVAEQLQNPEIVNYDELNNILNSVQNAIQYLDTINDDTLLHRFLHRIIENDNSIQLIDNLVYFAKGGKIHSNPLLIDNQLKYLTKHAEFIFSADGLNDEFRNKYWQSVHDVFAYSNLDFSNNDSFFISDLLRSGIHLNDYSSDLFSVEDIYSDDNDGKSISIPEGLSAKLSDFLELYSDNDKHGKLALFSLEYNNEKKLVFNQGLFKRDDFYNKLLHVVEFAKKYGLDKQYGINFNAFDISNPDFNILSIINFVNTNLDLYNNLVESYNVYNILRTYLYNNSDRLSDIANQLNIGEYILSAIGERVNSIELDLNRLVGDNELEYITKKIYVDQLLETLINPKDEIEEEIATSIIANNSNNDDLNNGKINENGITIRYNTLLTDYNQLALLMNEEDTNVLVGSYLNHPIKGNNINAIKKNCIGALVKRNVTISATKHRYLINTLRGLPKKILIAVIENMEDSVFNILGDGISIDNVPKQLTDDGATYVDSSMAILENNSLEDSAVGLDKKLFGAMVNAESGTGFILKTAGFALTCDRIRMSRLYLILNKKMKSKRWLYEGETFVNARKVDDNTNIVLFSLDGFVDITHDYLGNCIDYGNMNIYYAEPNLDADNNINYKYYHVVNVSINEFGLTIVTENVVDKNGNETGEPPRERNVGVINDNYTLWNKVLGGYNSCRFTDIDGEMQLSFLNCDYSHALLADLMCKLGESEFARNNTNSQIDLNSLNKKILSLSNVRQVLKEKMVSYVATDGAVKQGATNKNTLDAIRDDSYELTTMQLDTMDLGVQLDAEHSVEDTFVSLMTLVMNSAASRGYSINEGNEIYEALHKLTRISVGRILTGILSDDEEKLQQAKEEIAKIIITSAKKTASTSANLMQSIINGIRSTSNKTLLEILRKNIPVDHPQIMRKVLSDLIVSILKSGVRMKFRGNLLVLVPSNNIHRLYDGKTLDLFGGDYNLMMQLLENIMNERRASFLTSSYDKDLLLALKRTDYVYYKGRRTPIMMIYARIKAGQYDRDIAEGAFTNSAQNNVNPYVITQTSRIEPGKVYEYLNIATNERKLFKIDNPWDLWTFLGMMKNGNARNVLEYLPAGYDLGCENFYVYDANGINEYCIWDLDVIHKKWHNTIAINIMKKLPMDYAITQDDLLVDIDGKTYLKQSCVDNGDGTYSLTEHSIEANESQTVQEILNSLLNTNNELQKELLRLLNVLGANHDGDIIQVYNDGEEPLSVTIDRKTIEHKAFGAILPKWFKSLFGLTHEDFLSNISNDKYFFLKKLTRKILREKNKNIECNLSLIGADYTRHLLYTDDVYNFSIPKNNYREKKIYTKVINGKMFRIDPDTGNMMYLIPSIKSQSQEDEGFLIPNIKVFLNENNDEIIVTDNIGFFVDLRLHTNVNFYEIPDWQKQEYDNATDKLLSVVYQFFNSLRNSKIKLFKDFIANIEQETKLEQPNTDGFLNTFNNYINEYYRLVEELNNLDPNQQVSYDEYGNMTRSLLRSALIMHGSFLDALNFIASRTPAQCQQSFMAMTAEALSTHENNAVYVSRFLLWLEGSDFT